MTALPLHAKVSAARVRRAGFAMLMAALVAGTLTDSARAADRLAGTVKAITEHGFTRLVFTFAQPVPAKIQLRWPVIVIRFKRPVNVAVDQLGTAAPAFIAAARIDPDGGAVRIALTRHVKINATPAAERLYVDLLPENWRGLLPGLPKSEIKRLVARAREADRLLQQQHRNAALHAPALIRVRVATSPTFTRFLFDMPPDANVVSMRDKGTVTLKFDRAIRWDLTDALSAMPQTVKSIKTSHRDMESAVSFVLKGKPNVRTFRDGRSFAIDIGHNGSLASASFKPEMVPDTPAPLLAISPPATTPARNQPHDRARAAQNPGLPPLVDVPAPKPPGAKAAPPPQAAIMARMRMPPGRIKANKPSQPSMQLNQVEAPAPPQQPKPAVLAVSPNSPKSPKPDKSAQAAKVAKVAKATPQPAAAPAAHPVQKAKIVSPAPVRQASQPALPVASKPLPRPSKSKAAAKPAFVNVVPPPLPGQVKTEAKANVKAQATTQTKAKPTAKVKTAAKTPAETRTRSLIPPPNPSAPIVVGAHQGTDLLRLEFPFAQPTPAAAFTRAGTLWLVFDTKAKLDLKALKTRAADIIRSVTLTRGAEGEAILRILLKQPELVSLDPEGPAWMVAIGDVVAAPPYPLDVVRSTVGRSRAEIVIPFDHPASEHTIIDPVVGDRLMVITALGPTRSFVLPRHYVDLDLLASAQGVVVRPIADDVAVALTANKITLGRPGGLALSTAAVSDMGSAGDLSDLPFDAQTWGFNRKTNYEQRQDRLIRDAAEAPPQRRMQARLNLARFYLARGMAAEAKGVLTVALSDQGGVADVTGSVLSAVADVMMRRPHSALKALDQPQVGDQLDAPVWRAVAYARAHKWAKARAGFKHIESKIAALPIELQRMAMMAALRTAIAVRDYDSASRLADEFDSMGVPTSMTPAYAVLVGQLDQGLGRTSDALNQYRMAAISSDGPAAAKGRLHEIELRHKLGKMSDKQAIAALQMLTTVWRGDATELKGLRLLEQLYTTAGRYREAFHVMRTAVLAHPGSPITRQIQNEAATTFDNLFLSHQGDTMPPLKALALFYDYRELTPIGPRGDEMIRQLADRLVSVDLLDQAAELLQHQVDHRLQGAARAQVATHLALIYLMDHKPRRALATLRATRDAGLGGELRDKRLLLQARALSDIGQHGLALELIANIKGHTAMRLRADILWAAHRWRRAAETIERLYGDRWKQFKPLSSTARFDIMRAAIGYALSNETMQLARLRRRYMPKMAQGPDRRAFEIVSAPIGTANSDFQNVAQQVGNVSTLDAFLRQMRMAYPDKPLAAAQPAPDVGALPRPAKPQVVPVSASAASATLKPAIPPEPPSKPAKPRAVPTGSITQ